MSGYSIAKNFDQFFKIRFANTKELQQEAYKIRYGVYSEELGWEPSNEERMESDDCDDFSYHCLLEHRRTGIYAGCIRLIIPPAENPSYQLPFEAHCLESAKKEVLDTQSLPRGGFGEISRLAVLASFRRREQEKNKPYVLSNVDPDTMYSAEERRNFPNIAIGLYLGGLALASMCHHVGIMVMMEPRLNRRLQRFGLPFKQVGEEMDYHGRRAMFFLEEENFYVDLNEQMQELYEIVYQELSTQIQLKPYGSDGQFGIPEIYRAPTT
ncbi:MULTISPECIES: PEP-CTERM/exosortase system-associated acyltransferase [Thalassotalea]|uniref:PEP-CTERM/exosortase system-associated acyltransferase n=1 Tax=Thalassotalea TaxID=1518149 RepID=UPI000944385B|nr:MULTISPECIES: PEP-CTERM/exosortase system-associated acyltransferase [Thalassotalea]OKY26810.1 GNAT family N-acetyltransferase [Thalassotalea sp. PP2-459]